MKSGGGTARVICNQQFITILRAAARVEAVVTTIPSAILRDSFASTRSP